MNVLKGYSETTIGAHEVDAAHIISQVHRAGGLLADVF